MVKIKKNISFKTILLFLALIITIVPLILSYIISVKSKLSDNDERINIFLKLDQKIDAKYPRNFSQIKKKPL